MPVNSHTFANLVRIEQLRKIESVKAGELSYDGVKNMPGSTSGDFNYAEFVDRLSIRAGHLIRDNALEDALQQPRRQFVRARWICLALAVILGGLASSQAVSESSTLNIYWLLAVLLGFNTLSLLLWLSGIALNLQELS